MTKAWWFLSFGDAGRAPRAAIVEARGFFDAVQVARRRGCNPGGEVFGQKIPPEDLAKVPAGMRYKTLTATEIQAIWEDAEVRPLRKSDVDDGRCAGCDTDLVP